MLQGFAMFTNHMHQEKRQVLECYATRKSSIDKPYRFKKNSRLVNKQIPPPKQHIQVSETIVKKHKKISIATK